MIDKNDIQKILNEFTFKIVRNDNHIEQTILTKPFYIPHAVYASDTFSIVKIEKKDIPDFDANNYQNLDTVNKPFAAQVKNVISYIFEKNIENNLTFTINFAKFTEKFNNIKYTNMNVMLEDVCPVCNSSGVIADELFDIVEETETTVYGKMILKMKLIPTRTNHSFKICKKCGGHGYIEPRKEWNRRKERLNVFLTDSICISYANLEKVVKAFKMLNAESFMLYKPEKWNTVCVFENKIKISIGLKMNVCNDDEYAIKLDLV